ncbi:hypothetical protein TNCV_3534811 [Trichonephila clavipes]|nr:hypothetical protein TNCV_3534811 [Trichonephila clavipes]
MHKISEQQTNAFKDESGASITNFPPLTCKVSPRLRRLPVSNENRLVIAGHFPRKLRSYTWNRRRREIALDAGWKGEVRAVTGLSNVTSREPAIIGWSERRGGGG